MNNYKVHAGLGAITLISGINFILAKMVIPQHLGPLALVMVRVSLATVFFWLLSDLRKSTAWPAPALWPLVLGCTLFGNFLNHIFFFKGLALTSPINAAVITTTTPLFVLIFSVLLKKETLTAPKLLGIAAAGIGALLLVGVGNIHLDGKSMWGDLLCFLNCISYAINLILLKRLTGQAQPLSIQKWIFVLGTIFLAPVGFTEVSEVDWANLPSFAWWIIAYNTLFSIITIHLLKVVVLKQVQPSLIGTYMYLQPVVTALLGVYLGRADLTWQKGLFASVIIAGVALTAWKPGRVAADPEEIETS